MNNMFRVICVAIAAAGIASGVRAEDKKYSLQDLQALEKTKSWNELLTHLLDVPPAQRSTAWNRLVESTCTQPDSGQVKGEWSQAMDSLRAEYCFEPLKSVLASEPQNTAFAWKAGQWARLNMKSSEAVPFFMKAGLKAGDPRCKEEDVSLAVVSGLGLPKDTYPEIVSGSQTLAFDACYAQVSGALKKALKPNSYFSENACPGLKKKGKLSDEDAAKCS